ncbi:hypothetical protein [Dactylosporangium sp. NPDC051541]|uniref:hypothetical protein n=1 Tax=Dactylosporangium sp. NPDC051541 TaxID=3363977 RepID=UPI0037884ED2
MLNAKSVEIGDLTVCNNCNEAANGAGLARADLGGRPVTHSASRRLGKPAAWS